MNHQVDKVDIVHCKYMRAFRGQLQTLSNKPIQWTVYYISQALSLGTHGIYQEYDEGCMRV